MTNMRFSARLQLLTCLVLYASSAHAIMVKFGTKGGPIVPPTPEPVVLPSQPYRSPAPVWEERSNDTPDPNAQWRPQLFIPQPRYTQVIFNIPKSPQPLSNAQRFVNSYIPKHQPIQAQPELNYFNPTQILSSQTLPGFGLRYFVPAYVNDLERKDVKQEDAVNNQVDTDVNLVNKDSGDDLQWKYEKESAKRTIRNTPEGKASPYVYQWPVYVPRRHQ